MSKALKEFLTASQNRVERALEARLPDANTIPQKLHEAMRYCTLEGGKRMRPMLTYSAGKALGLNPDILDAPACAVEFIHVYSLIHDDLPAMDDDDLRRGRPTCHKAFD
ncbi:MAG: polyprenyl synthetase family protein, partial [Methyloprofundus sp.]|nr:polyprenyl synthetase family protein [Methyloprofundus sp.]